MPNKGYFKSLAPQEGHGINIKEYGKPHECKLTNEKVNCMQGTQQAWLSRSWDHEKWQPCCRCHSPSIREWNSCICTHASCLKFLKFELGNFSKPQKPFKNNQHLNLIKRVQENVPIILWKILVRGKIQTNIFGITEVFILGLWN